MNSSEEDKPVREDVSKNNVKEAVKWGGCPAPPPGWNQVPVSANSVSLSKVLSVFNGLITEEHAWAIIYECCKTLEDILNEAKNKIYIVASANEILLQKDGRVHLATFLNATNEGNSRKFTSTVDKAITQLGEVIYAALDYGLTEEDERQLSPELENLLATMASANENEAGAKEYEDDDEEEEEEEEDRIETDDEGIEQDHYDEDKALKGRCSQSSRNLQSIDRLVGLCANHLSASQEAASHYRNVCRALVSEALEFSTFMEKMKRPQDSNHAKEIQEIALLDWADLWKETMYQLRQGVKLKKLDYTKTPYEYALTPYEMLMDDIRSRRYKLNKVMVNGNIPPKVKKDAHDIILEFIRSRPPLKPVSRRTLPPKKLDTTPQELLMKSICSPSAKASLKKTPGPKRFDTSISNGTGERRSPLSHIKKLSAPAILSSSHGSTTKRLIRPDPDFLQLDSNDDDDEDEDDEDNLTSLRSIPPSRRQIIGGSLLNLSETAGRNAMLDMINSSSFSTVPPNVVVSSPTSTNQPWQRLMSYNGSDRFLSGSGPDEISPIITNNSSVKNKRAMSFTSTPNKTNMSERSVNHDWTSLNAADLTLEELSHIRSVHTKADIENRAINSQQRNDLEKSKICFLCMKNHFGLFVWSYNCKLCHQAVCSSCLTKITIPNSSWSNISVFSLSFAGNETMEGRLARTQQQRSFLKANSSSNLSNRGRYELVASPNNNNNKQISEISNSPITSTPTMSSNDTKVRLRRSYTVKYDRNPEQKLDSCKINVCVECKSIVTQTLRFRQSNNRRQLLTRSLCLNY